MRWIGGLLLCLAAHAATAPAGGTYVLSGELQPRAFAVVSLFGVSTPFAAHTFTERDGRFKFKKLVPGTYQLTLNSRRRGEVRQTVEIGPKTADGKRRVKLALAVAQLNWVKTPEGRVLVNVRELSVPEKAKKEYAEAQKRLSKGDTEGATERLKRAVEISPQYVAAWNYLGTIAYQTKQFPEAEQYFREALRANPDAFEPTVNLGGVLLALEQVKDAIVYNEKAVQLRPADALANAQLGIGYYQVGRFDEAERYLRRAKALDPAHFSHPQLMLSHIYYRKGNRRAAAAELEDFLRRHPDYPEAAKLRDQIARLR